VGQETRVAVEETVQCRSSPDVAVAVEDGEGIVGLSVSRGRDAAPVAGM
jgi:hypothetical protein